jgi:glyoxylase-like metal-dependent hydrolase (beta-lactamase superfamily II)
VRAERFEAVLWQTSSLLLVDGAGAVAVDPCISRAEVGRGRRADEPGARVVAVLATHADCGESWRRIERAAAEYGLEVAGPPRVDRRLATGAAHAVGPFTVETLAVPGHTPDGTAFRSRAPDLLAVGDHLSTAEFPFASSTAAYRTTLASARRAASAARA